MIFVRHPSFQQGGLLEVSKMNIVLVADEPIVLIYMFVFSVRECVCACVWAFLII